MSKLDSNDSDRYQAPVLDTLGRVLLVVAWTASFVEVGLVWSPPKEGEWLALELVAMSTGIGLSALAMFRSREPVLGRMHWLTLASCFLITMLSMTAGECSP